MTNVIRETIIGYKLKNFIIYILYVIECIKTNTNDYE